MNVFIILAHPEPKSFNAALFRTAVSVFEANGHAVRTSDLHAMGFDPVSDRRNFTTTKDAEYFKQQQEEIYATEIGGFAAAIEAELRKLEWCDLMIWQFPLAWFSVPAMLKGWIDRVLAMGRIYGLGQIYENGSCKAKRAMLSLTTGGPRQGYERDGFNGDINAILRPIQRGVLEFVGFSVLAPNIVYGPARMPEGEREAALAAYERRLKGLSPEMPIVVGRY